MLKLNEVVFEINVLKFSNVECVASFCRSDLSPLETVLMLTPILERSLADVLSTIEPGKKVPSLMRDLVRIDFRQFWFFFSQSLKLKWNLKLKGSAGQDAKLCGSSLFWSTVVKNFKFLPIFLVEFEFWCLFQNYLFINRNWILFILTELYKKKIYQQSLVSWNFYVQFNLFTDHGTSFSQPLEKWRWWFL